MILESFAMLHMVNSMFTQLMDHLLCVLLVEWMSETIIQVLGKDNFGKGSLFCNKL